MNRTVRIPFLADHHNHVSFYSSLTGCLDLGNESDKGRALAKLGDHPVHEISVVLGWNSGFYSFSAEELGLLPPLIIINLSLHSFLITPSAEEILRPRYPEIISNYRDAAWFENHMPEMLIFAAEQAGITAEKISAFFDRLERLGVYYAEDMLMPGESFHGILRETPFLGRTGCWTTPSVFRELPPETRRQVKGIKLFLDGALGARSAALSKPFLGGVQGWLLHDDESLYHQIRQAGDWGKALAIHAIGDLATDQAVRVIRQVACESASLPGIRIEHLQFIRPETAREAKNLGLILSMQPNFNVDSTAYADRLPREFLETNNPFRMLIDHAGFIPGRDLILGSDGMPHGALAALSSVLFPPFAGQRLTLEEFTAAACMPDFSHGTLEATISSGAVEIARCSL